MKFHAFDGRISASWKHKLNKCGLINGIMCHTYSTLGALRVKIDIYNVMESNMLFLWFDL